MQKTVIVGINSAKILTFWKNNFTRSKQQKKEKSLVFDVETEMAFQSPRQNLIKCQQNTYSTQSGPELPDPTGKHWQPAGLNQTMALPWNHSSQVLQQDCWVWGNISTLPPIGNFKVCGNILATSLFEVNSLTMQQIKTVMEILLTNLTVPKIIEQILHFDLSQYAEKQKKKELHFNI